MYSSFVASWSIEGSSTAAGQAGSADDLVLVAGAGMTPLPDRPLVASHAPYSRAEQ